MTTANPTTAADRLRWIANQIDSSGYGHADLHITVMIQPEDNGDIAAVDTIAASLGTDATTRRLSSGCWHHTGRRKWGRIEVTAMTEVAEPAAEKRARLNAELAALDADVAANTARTEVPA